MDTTRICRPGPPMSPLTLEDWESEYSDWEDENSSVIYNKSLVQYTTLLPDYSNVSFGDSDSVTEDSEPDSISSFSDLGLATQVKALMIALGDERRERE